MARRRRPPRPGALSEHEPWRILKKMLLLQAIYYLSAAILIVFAVLVAGKAVSIDLIFDWRTIRSDSTVGWMMAMLWVLTGLINVISLLLIVVRSKLVPDFALTVHGIHLVATSLYTRGIPTSFFWWATQASAAAIMTVLGVWSCQWRELKPMSFSFGGALSAGGGAAKTPADVEQSAGLLGAGGDAASGSYEMANRRANA